MCCIRFLTLIISTSYCIIDNCYVLLFVIVINAAKNILAYIISHIYVFIKYLEIYSEAVPCVSTECQAETNLLPATKELTLQQGRQIYHQTGIARKGEG